MEIDIGDGWRAAFKLSGPQPIVTELRVFPADPTAIPESGLTYSHIRSLNISEALKVHRAQNQDRSSRRGYSKIIQQEPMRPGRNGHDQRFLAVCCRFYVDAVQAGSTSPINDVTERLNAMGQPYSRESVRSLIHRARTQDQPLLTPSTTQGRPGGILTDHARQLLADDKRGRA